MNKIILILILNLICLNLFSQDNSNNSINLNTTIPSNVKISGTSTLHDWESIVEKTQAKLVINNYEDLEIETLEVTIDALSIKSGKKLMDKLTYKALRAKDFPKITFIFKKGSVKSSTPDFINIELNGDLMIAGVTKNVTVLTKINKKGKSIILTGTYKLKMTTYNIKPPKALLGTIKTGDEITIDFSLNFN